MISNVRMNLQGGWTGASSTLKVSSVLVEPMWKSSPTHVLLTLQVPARSGVKVAVYLPSEAVEIVR